MSVNQQTREIFLPERKMLDRRRLSGGKNLDGSIWMDIEGMGRITMTPQQAWDHAIGILKGLGVVVHVGE